MPTNLTLTLDTQVVEQAEAYAQAQGKSLAAVLEEYVRQLGARTPEALPELPPEMLRLRGAIQLPPGTDYKQALAQAIQERHGA